MIQWENAQDFNCNRNTGIYMQTDLKKMNDESQRGPKRPQKCLLRLRILAMHEAKNSKICNFWTIWPVIQLINDHLQI